MREYRKPMVSTEKSFESNALACGKTPVPPNGSKHWAGAYDTITGHLGPGFGTAESATGAGGVGFGPGDESESYFYYGLCTNWITLSS